MPTGTCDPASRGQTWNEAEQTFGTAGSITYRYGWDGVSTKETGCVGPLNRVQVVNGNPETWYAHFQGKRGTWRRIVLDAGVSRSYTSGQLQSQGFIDNTDLEGLYLTTDPLPPTTA